VRTIEETQMAFSQKQDQAVKDWIAKWTPKCPVCGRVPTSYYTDFVQLNMFDPSSQLKLNVQDVLCVCVTCNKCGFYWLVGCREANIPAKPESK
jgi:hypothetical protein